MIKKIMILLQLCILSAMGAKAQQDNASFAIKTNLLYDATTTFNLGGEVRTADKYTLDLSVNYNPWTFSNNKKLKHILVQPEFRYWTNETFKGHFVGVHALYAFYNAGGVKLPFGFIPGLETNRYQGNMYGVGFSYGYQWHLNSNWNLEATLGLGYVRAEYDRYYCQNCGDFINKSKDNYWGPTKIGISLIYLIK